MQFKHLKGSKLYGKALGMTRLRGLKWPSLMQNGSMTAQQLKGSCCSPSRRDRFGDANTQSAFSGNAMNNYLYSRVQGELLSHCCSMLYTDGPVQLQSQNEEYCHTYCLCHLLADCLLKSPASMMLTSSITDLISHNHTFRWQCSNSLLS